MPGTPYPEYDDDAATAAGDPVDPHTLGQSLANALDGLRSGASRTEGGVARAEALERLRQQFLSAEPGVQGMRPSTMYTKSEFTEWPERMTHEELVKPDARLEKWADVAMWQAPAHVDPQRPKVTVSVCTPDPLGVMAMVNAQYTGRNLTDPLQVTDEERREAWEAATVSKLSETPLEWIQLSINFENVSRAFTHQMVRTRMATYAQESQRFAVKDDIGDAVKLPPSLAGTQPMDDIIAKYMEMGVDPEKNWTQEEFWRINWDSALAMIAECYGKMVNTGMPAEDARGILPTNTLTRIHQRIDMKTLLGLAGARLCTQAQFEWRAVFAELAEAIRAYGFITAAPDTQWQYNLIADSFRPVCFMANRCPMKAKSDRHCSIRAQVDEFESAGVKSSEWEDRGYPPAHGLKPIDPRQWLADPTAARKAPGQE